MYKCKTSHCKNFGKELSWTGGALWCAACGFTVPPTPTEKLIARQERERSMRHGREHALSQVRAAIEKKGYDVDGSYGMPASIVFERILGVLDELENSSEFSS